MNPNAQKTVDFWRRQRIKKRVVRIFVPLCIFGALLNVNDDATIDLPEAHEPVIVWTGENWYKAYLDSAGEFRSFEDGMTVGQVVKWKRPREPLW